MADGAMRWGEPIPRAADPARLYVARGLEDAIRHRAITPEAAATFAHRMTEAPHLENMWRCSWDPATETVTSAEWLCRGSRGLVLFVDGEFQCRDMAVHNHPGVHAEGLVPSDADIETAGRLALKGVGFGIISNDQSEFLLIRAPRMPIRVSEWKTWRVGPKSWDFTFSKTIVRRLLP